MKCPFCEAELEEGSVFCTECGNRLDDESLADAAATQSLNDELTLAFDKENDSETFSIEDEDSGEYASDDYEEMPAESAEYSDLSSEESENAEPSEELSDEATPDESEEQAPEVVENSPSTPGDKLSIAVILLSAALFAITGFLFVDRILSLTPSDSRATTIRIVSQSEDVTVKEGTTTEFFVDAEGTNLTYQWYVKKSGEQLWHAWKNHNNFKTVSKANQSWDGMQVYCMITDNNRTSLASEIITVTIEK